MAANSQDFHLLVKQALDNEVFLKETLDDLQGPSRRNRQNAAAILYAVSKEDLAKLSGYGDVFVESLNVPEARTRWEALEVLTRLAQTQPDVCEKAIEGAEASLFDEQSGPVRLSAMRFLCKLGTVSPELADKVWPLIDEGIQCYHGDLEFNDMLQSLVEFSSASLSEEVRSSLKARMEFDAEHAKGSLKHFAEVIIGNLA